jgi:hypothetical protein
MPTLQDYSVDQARSDSATESESEPEIVVDTVIPSVVFVYTF